MFCHSILLLNSIHNISVFSAKREVLPVIICRIQEEFPLPLMLVAHEPACIFQSCKLYLYSAASWLAGTCKVYVLDTRANKNIHKPKIQRMQKHLSLQQLWNSCLQAYWMLSGTRTIKTKIITAVKIHVSWDTTPCRLIKLPNFRGASCLHIFRYDIIRWHSRYT
jgi:hypothetical protein